MDRNGAMPHPAAARVRFGRLFYSNGKPYNGGFQKGKVSFVSEPASVGA